MAIYLFNTLQSNYFIEECIRENLNNPTTTYFRIHNVETIRRIEQVFMYTVTLYEVFLYGNVSILKSFSYKFYKKSQFKRLNVYLFPMVHIN